MSLQAQQKHLRSNPVKTLGGNAATRLVFSLLGFANTVLLANMLGPKEMGIYALGMAIASFLCIPAQFGIPTLAIRELAIYQTRQDWPLMQGFIRRAQQAILSLSLVLAGIGILTLLLLRNEFSSAKFETFLVALTLVPLLALGALRAGMLKGLHHVILGSMPEDVIRPLVFFVLLLALMVVNQQSASPLWVMTMQLLAGLIAFAIGQYFFWKKKPGALASTSPAFADKSWLQSCVPLSMTAILYYLSNQTDILVLGLFASDAEVGIYRIALQMAFMIAFGVMVLNNIQAPRIARLHATGNHAQLQHMLIKTCWWNTALSLPIIIVLVVWGKPLLTLAFGDDFADAYIPLLILCIGQVANVVLGPVDVLLNMTGHEKTTTRAIAIAAISSLTLNFTLIPLLGIVGAAIATAATLCLWKSILWHNAYQLLGIETSALMQRRKV